MSLLYVNKLSLTFRHKDRVVEAVKNISFTIEKGEMLAVVGESGSGKSLSALACLGLQPPAAAVSGSITLDGKEVISASEATLQSIRGKEISMVFQEPMTALNPLHTIGKQIAEMITFHCHSGEGRNPRLANRKMPDMDPGLRRDDKDRIHELLESVGLSHMKDRLHSYPHELSGGERQRVMIAMAIANEPSLLIADEPTTAVDVTVQAKILKLIKDLQKSRNMAVLFITHDLTVVKKLADRVAIMKQGEIVEQGKVSEIFAAPKHPYTQKLLSSEPKGEAVPLPSSPHTLMACESLKVHFPIKKGVFGRVVNYVKAVDDITLSIPKGSTLGVVGESGSGKSTLGFALLRMIPSQGKIAYLPSPDADTVHLDTLSGKGLRNLRRHMQPVFQDPFASLNPRMTIQQIIEEGILVHFPELSQEARDAMVDGILEEVGLSADIKQRFPHEFSGGQRQRISIARAMVLKPSFVVLDEPTSALDLTVQSTIIDLLKNLQQKYGLTYIFISHDLRVVRAIAHNIVVIYKGKIIEHGETKQIFANAKEDYTKNLIKAAMLE
ncbi:MAG: ABC transporter ATP-binding protein [Alphaproteobacteria bacterium]